MYSIVSTLCRDFKISLFRVLIKIFVSNHTGLQIQDLLGISGHLFFGFNICLKMYENVCARLVIMEKHFTRNSRKLNVNVIIYKKFNYNETTSYNAMPGQK